MKLIEKLSNMIEAEIEDAEQYAKCALKYKEENTSLANVFYSLSIDELKHMSMLHDEVTRAINQYRNEKGEPPEAMKAVYDYLHSTHIDDVNEVKLYQAQFK